MKVKQSVVTAMLVGAGVAAFAFFAPLAATWATVPAAEASQPPQAEQEGQGGDEGSSRRSAPTPDPVKFPVPRTKWDGKPDFSGVYMAGTYLPRGEESITNALHLLASLYRPEAHAARAKLNPEDSPPMYCWPESPLNGGMHPNLDIQLISAPGFLAVINPYGSNNRIIPTDGRPHDPSAKPTFGGDSVGHWEGDTLVVDVTNFRVRNKISNRFLDTSTEALHVVERWTRPDARSIEYEMRAEDPKTLTAPWAAPIIRRARKANQDFAQENFCVQDETLAMINKEQLEYSGKGIRKRWNRPGGGGSVGRKQ